LIATYERGHFPWDSGPRPQRHSVRALLMGGAREITVLAIASPGRPGLATTPYAAYHFHRMAPYQGAHRQPARHADHFRTLDGPAGLLALGG